MNTNSIIGSESSKIFIDINTLTNWSNQINNLNEEAIEILNNLKSTITSLEEYWVGNCSKGFIEDSGSLVENVRKCHNDMKSIPVGLNEMIKIKSNE